jgi:Polyketide cyclase / dehydrase and lipid transport
VMEVERLGEWVSTHREIVEAPEGKLRPGSTFRQGLRVAGVSFEVRWEVTRLEPPRLVEWRGEGPGGSRARVRYALEPRAGGRATGFQYENEFQLPGGRLTELAGRGIGEQRGRSEAEHSLRNLKRLLERRS